MDDPYGVMKNYNLPEIQSVLASIDSQSQDNKPHFTLPAPVINNIGLIESSHTEESDEESRDTEKSSIDPRKKSRDFNFNKVRTYMHKVCSKYNITFIEIQLNRVSCMAADVSGSTGRPLNYPSFIANFVPICQNYDVSGWPAETVEAIMQAVTPHLPKYKRANKNKSNDVFKEWITASGLQEFRQNASDSE